MLDHRLDDEYVSLIIGLDKNNGSVLHVAINFLFSWSLYPARNYLHHGNLQVCSFHLVPNKMGFHHGQILIGTETDSLGP